jgi:hypothetical protein
MKTDAMKKSQPRVLLAIISGLTRFMSNLRFWMEQIIPVGYQDESGFHVGIKR